MKYRKGFTLIELLVVIAIIGILSAIVLAALNVAKSKGLDASTKSDMTSMRNAGEIFYYNQTPNSYNTNGPGPLNPITTCDLATANQVFSDTVSNMKSLITQAQGAALAIDCGNTSTAWSVAVQLKDATYWCVDSTGVARGSTAGGIVYNSLTGGSKSAHASVGSPSCQ